MANTQVFVGSDATLTLASEDTPEGKDAKDVIDRYKLSPVGRARNVKVHVRTDLEAFYQIGQRHPASLHAGNISVDGTIERAYINGALLSLLLGKGAQVARVNEPYPAPALNLMLNLTDPAIPANTSTLTVHGVKFDNWSFDLPEDDFVLESVTFKGLFVTVEDKEASGSPG
jgi:hypothetical protein